MSGPALRLAALLWLGVASSACRDRAREPGPEATSPARATTPALSLVPPADDDPTYRLPDAPRVVAIGDVHGDLAATRRALRLAGALDANDRWSGGKLVVVQTGDQLDRGDDEREILELFSALAPQARAAGGALHVLVGNHELMNVAGDLRYVTPGGLADFAAESDSAVSDTQLARFPTEARGRARAFLPGGPYARKLADHPVVLQVGPTVFAHGGILPAHVEHGLGRLNRQVARWMRGEAPAPALTEGDDSPVWTRRYSDGTPDPAACRDLSRVLAALGATRMVVGHTVQKQGISAGCEDRVWRIDVGLAAHYGGGVEVLEIMGAKVRTLKPDG